MSSVWDDAIVVATWNPKNEFEYDAGACRKGCPHTLSMGNGGDLLGDGSFTVPWDCQHGSWLMPTEAPAGWAAGASVSHASKLDWEESGLAAACVAWLAPQRDSLSFGDLVFLEDMEFYAAETPQERAARKEAMALRDAQDAGRVIASKVARKEEKWRGGQEFRVPRPCKYASLFAKRICANCSAHVPEGQSSCSASIVMVEEQERRHNGRTAGTGKMVARLAKPGDTGVRTCGEKLAGCWLHDQHRSCIYVHPDEPQWDAACAGTLRVKTDNRLIFCMAGEEVSRDFRRFDALASGKKVGGSQKVCGSQKPNGRR